MAIEILPSKLKQRVVEQALQSRGVAIHYVRQTTPAEDTATYHLDKIRRANSGDIYARDSFWAAYSRMYVRYVYLNELQDDAYANEYSRLGEIVNILDGRVDAAWREKLNEIANAVEPTLFAEARQRLRGETATQAGLVPAKTPAAVAHEAALLMARRIQGGLPLNKAGLNHLVQGAIAERTRPLTYRVQGMTPEESVTFFIRSADNFGDSTATGYVLTYAELFAKQSALAFVGGAEFDKLGAMNTIIRRAAREVPGVIEALDQIEVATLQAIQAELNARSEWQTGVPQPAPPLPPAPVVKKVPKAKRGPLQFTVRDSTDEMSDQVLAAQRALVSSISDYQEQRKARELLEKLTTNWAEYPKSAAYVGTLFAPKPDAFGRFLLLDCSSEFGTRDGNVNTWLAGGRQPGSGTPPMCVRLGGGFSNQDLVEIDGKMYARSHTPGGAEIRGGGIGTLLYMTHALSAYVLRGGDGCYSYPGGRSDLAEAWWSRAIKKRPGKVRLAQRIPGTKTYGGYAKHCITIKNRNLINPYGIKGFINSAQDKELCGNVSLDWNITPKDVLTVEAVIDSGLVAFAPIPPGMTSDLPVPLGHTPAWNLKTVDVPSTGIKPRFDLFFSRGPNGVYRARGDRVVYNMTEARAELFARSHHGVSPVLAAVILDLLSRSFEDQAVIYATRPDIVPMLVGNKTLARIIENREAALPGVQGLSAAAHQEIVGALHGFASGIVESPKPLPAVSAETKALLKPFSDLD